MEFQFTPVSSKNGPDVLDLSRDPRLRLLAECIVLQQEAKFDTRIDMRQVPCPCCKAPGFNTGWGAWRHMCGAETLSDGTIGIDCPDRGRRPQTLRTGRTAG